MRWNLFWSRIFLYLHFYKIWDETWRIFSLREQVIEIEIRLLKWFHRIMCFHITSYAYMLCHTTQQILLHMQISTWQKPCNDFMPFRTVNCRRWSLIHVNDYEIVIIFSLSAITWHDIQQLSINLHIRISQFVHLMKWQNNSCKFV